MQCRMVACTLALQWQYMVISLTHKEHISPVRLLVFKCNFHLHTLLSYVHTKGPLRELSLVLVISCSCHSPFSLNMKAKDDFHVFIIVLLWENVNLSYCEAETFGLYNLLLYDHLIKIHSHSAQQSCTQIQYSSVCITMS